MDKGEKNMDRTSNSQTIAVVLATILALAMALSLVSCAPAPPEEVTEVTEEAPAEVPEATEETEEVPAEVPTGTLDMIIWEDFRGISPVVHDNQRVFWGIIGINLYEPLIVRNAEGKLEPRLAVSWEPIDETTWEFKLREGVTFHNGEPFNAEAVKYTVEKYLDPEVAAPAAFFFTMIESVEVVDDYTVRIHTKEPFGALLANLPMLNIMPPKAGEETDLNVNPIGTGPFKFVMWKKGDRFEMEANKDYWGGSPKLERVVFRPIIEASTRVAALLTGEADVVYTVPVEELSTVQADPNVDVIVVPGVDTVNITMGGKNAPWNDKRVRLAIWYGIDIKTIVDTVVGDAGELAESFTAPLVFGYNDELPFREYDPEKAKELLAEAGYPDGFSADFVTPAGFYPKGEEVAEAVAEYLKEIGVEVQVKPTEMGTAWSILDSEDFDMFLAGWAAMTLDGDFAFYRNFHSSQSREHYNNPEVDRLLDIGRSSTDQAEREAAYKEAQVRMYEDAPRIPLYHPTSIYGIRKDVKNFPTRSDEFMPLQDVNIEG